MAIRTHDGAHERKPASDTLVIEPIPFALLDDPLEYIAAEHFRARAVCSALSRLAEAGKAFRDEADRVIAYLDCDFPLHHEDEEADLFPLLRQRAAADDLGITLARLGSDHRKSEALAADIVTVLAQGTRNATLHLAGRTRDLMRAFSASQRRHLALENGVVLAIARIRLTRADLTGMSRRMKARRGGG